MTDKLTSVLSQAYPILEIKGVRLEIKPWPLRKALRFSGRLIGILQQLFKDAKFDLAKMKDEDFISEILKLDIGLVLSTYADEIADILTGSIEGKPEDNLLPPSEAKVFVDKLEMDDAVTLLGEVVKQNYRPFLNAIKKLGSTLPKK